MTPKKDAKKQREATVVYPGTSPQLMLAYRIFGPGHDSLEKLALQKNYVIKTNQDDEGDNLLTEVGMDIAKSMKLDVDQIMAAYETYKKEIKRMNKADRMHEKRKQAQLDGVDPEDIDEDEDDSDDSDDVEEAESSSSSSGGQANEGGSDEGDGEDKQDEAEPEEGKDRFKKFLGPDLWLSKEECLTRAKNIRDVIERMHPIVDSILDNYNEELPNRKDVLQAIDKAVNNFINVRRYAYHLERLINIHDNKTPVNTWKSPERLGVTYGENVPETLHIVYEFPPRVEDMRKALAVCERVRDRFLAATLLTQKKQLMKELVFNLRRFASMACTKEVRGPFLKQLKDERKRWSPESSPDAEEFFRKRTKTDAAQSPSDAAAPTQG